MSDEIENIGEIHILVRPGNEVEISTSFPVSQLFLALATVQKMILDGDLNTPAE